MLTERGRIVALESDSAWVETLRQSACGRCSARAGCGHGLLNGALAGSSRGLVRAQLSQGLRERLSVHDEVELSLPERSFLRAAALLYLLPLFGALVAALAGDHFLVDAGTSRSVADLTVSVAAAFGLLSGLLVVRLLARRGDAASEPVITARF